MTKYILPSQPPTRFNRETAEYYRKNDNYRAIAYYLEGYLCTLIDGHHKAVASAVEHRPLKTLVIIPTNSGWYKSKHLNEKLGGISLNGVSLYQNEMITSLQQTIYLFKFNRMPDEEALNLVTALYTLEHPRFRELALHFCSYSGFVEIWHDIFMLLSKIKDEDVENFFIQYLIDAEVERVELQKIIDDYLRDN